MVVDKRGRMLADKEKIDLCILIFDAKDNFESFLTPINNVHNCKDIKSSVRRLFEVYVNDIAPQVPLKCKVYFAYEDREDEDYIRWKDSGIIHPNNYKEVVPMFVSDKSGKITEPEEIVGPLK